MPYVIGYRHIIISTLANEGEVSVLLPLIIFSSNTYKNIILTFNEHFSVCKLKFI